MRETSSNLDKALMSLTSQQLKFWELMQSGKMTQEQAYRASYSVKASRPKAAVQRDACMLWAKPKFIQCRTALMNGITRQSIKDREVRIAEMQAFAERCEEAGQYGAACKARELVARLEGHYIEKTENINKTRDQLSSLKQIADSLGNDKALELADQVGLKDQLAQHLSSLH